MTTIQFIRSLALATLEPLASAELVDVEFSGIDHRDAPKYCDAFIQAAAWEFKLRVFNRTILTWYRELTLDELDAIDSDHVHELLMDFIH